jgi:hypothetical protein
MTNRWSIEPVYLRWSVDDSPVSVQTVTFTVNGIPAREQLGAFEPVNTTNDLLVNLGFHF